MKYGKRQHIYSSFLLLTFPLLAVCTGSIKQNDAVNISISHPVQTPPQTYVYECSDGYNFTVRIEGENAWLFRSTQTISLPHVPSGSGTKFSDGSTTYWSQGDEALLEVGKETYRGCKNNLAKAIWEDAKLRGIGFRAVGNEPGWYLEINENEKIVFINNYGENQYEFTTPEPLIDQLSRTTKYEVQDDTHELTITLKGKRCHDSMRDESFETAVTVIFDGKYFTGCGKALH